MKVGSSYYPELTNSKIWERDLALAKKLGLKTLRCGEFAWSRFSPEPGDWQDEWAVEFLDLALKHGFDVIWCTPSASLPPALFDRWPDLYATDCEGRTMPAGIRRNYCPSHEGYRKLCAETAARLSQAVGVHPAVQGWQVDNELAGDGFTCWCPRCGKAFQGWLQERYGSLEKLNRVWQTDVWAQRYTDWSQIPIPHKAFHAHAPSLKLAWRRFRSDNWLSFYSAQRQALKSARTAKPVTTNFYNLSWDIPFDRWKWRSKLDVIGLSHYLEDETDSRFELALLRGLDEKAVWVLEQKAGQQKAQNLYPESLDRIARHLRLCAEGGAKHAVYWHFRQHQSGVEMVHGAVLRHDGKEGRIGRAVQEAIADVQRVKPESLSRDHVLVFDFHQQWAQETRPAAGTAWDYRTTLEQDWFAAMREVWGPVSVGPFDEALRDARVVAAPHFQIAHAAQVQSVRKFLENGGTFITTADFGCLDEEGLVRPWPPLGALSQLVPVPEAEILDLKDGFAVTGRVAQAAIIGKCFWLISEGTPAEIHLRHEDESGPAFLELEVGPGRIVVMTLMFDRTSLEPILRQAMALPLPENFSVESSSPLSGSADQLQPSLQEL